MTIVDDFVKAAANGTQKQLSPDNFASAVQEIVARAVPPSQIAAFLLLHAAAPPPPESLLSAASALIAASPFAHVHGAEDAADIVGTGGDGLDTFNASTAASFVAAACGAAVVKHGNRSASGSCGSADFLEALGVSLNLDAAAASVALKECGYAFIFAQHAHPSLRSVAAIRRELGVRTFFNFLGPLMNPVKPRHMVIGAASTHAAEFYARAAASNPSAATLVVRSRDGADEITPSAPADAWLVVDGKVWRAFFFFFGGGDFISL